MFSSAFRPFWLEVFSRRFELVLFPLIFLTWTGLVFSQAAPSDTSASTTLELNKAIEREFSGSQQDKFQFKLSANQYVKILLEQKGVDIGAQLFGLDGKPIMTVDGEMRPSGVERIEFVAKDEGTYKLTVLSRFPFMPAGKYAIRMVDLHAASQKEVTRQEARSSFAESLRMFNAGKFDEAKTAINRTIDLDKQDFGTENAETASAMTQLARILDAQGEYDAAEKLNGEVLSIREKILPPDHPDIAYSLNYLAVNNNHKEEFQKAIDFHRRALAIREKAFGPDHPMVGVSLINLGVVYAALGDKLQAIEFYQRAMAIQEKTSGLENVNGAVVLNNIGETYNELGEYKKGEPFLLRAVAILEKIYKPDNPRISEALVSLAYCYVGQNDLAKAESIYKRVLVARENSLGPNHLLTAQVLYSLGNVSATRKDFEKADGFYSRALDIRERKLGAESPGIAEVLSAQALMFAQKGDIARALQLQQRANAIDERNIALNLNIGSERQKLAYLVSLFDRTNQSIAIQAGYAPNDPLAIDLALTTILRQKGRVLDAVSNSLSELRRRSDPNDQALLGDLDRISRQLSELILDGPGESAMAEHQAKIKELTDQREKLEDEISRRASGFYEKSQPVTLSSVRSLIPRDLALVEFVVYEPDAGDLLSTAKPHYAVYVLRSEGEIRWKDLGEIGPIDEVIDAYRGALRDPGNADVEKLGQKVYEKVMKAVQSMVGDSRHLLISPDGEMNLIPFEALVEETGNYLLQRYSFSYLTSGRDLLRMRVGRESKSTPLVVADPAFGAPDTAVAVSNDGQNAARRGGRRQSITTTRSLKDTYFAPLAGSAQEARSIQTLFRDARVLTGANANKAALKRAVAPRILHIATHGFFLVNPADRPGGGSPPNGATRQASITQNPLLRSGLALAGANHHGRQSEDGILTALEASGLNLWGTRLVVLSACDTGLGDVRTGEGVYGLRRSFTQAGAESLVMSLWPVSDIVTRELMVNYYKNLKQGLGRGEALRQVQLEMLKRPERRHPFYWASFIQSGEWANLDGKR